MSPCAIKNQSNIISKNGDIIAISLVPHESAANNNKTAVKHEIVVVFFERVKNKKHKEMLIIKNAANPSS